MHNAFIQGLAKVAVAVRAAAVAGAEEAIHDYLYQPNGICHNSSDSTFEHCLAAGRALSDVIHAAAVAKCADSGAPVAAPTFGPAVTPASAAPAVTPVSAVPAVTPVPAPTESPGGVTGRVKVALGGILDDVADDDNVEGVCASLKDFYDKDIDGYQVLQPAAWRSPHRTRRLQ